MNKRKTGMIAASLAFCFVVCALSGGILAIMTHGATPGVYAAPEANDFRINEPQADVNPYFGYKIVTPAAWVDPGVHPYVLITTH